MQLTNKIEWPAGRTDFGPAAKHSPAVEILAELPPHCAYNQTRECFLGLDVDCHRTLVRGS